jgi:NADH dehydrogenase
MDSRPQVVILGGGFGGLYAARALAGAPVDVTVVDKRNHHVFQPLLYQVATAALNPSDIASPIRRILRRQKNASVILAEAVRIDTKARRVVLADGSLAYDFLIVATGVTHSYFGRDDWSPNAPGLKTIEDALEIRKRILLGFERAERETEPEEQRRWLTFVVIGGGPTGVELAGALGEIARHVLTRDFRRVDPTSARVVLIEAGPRILPTFAAASSSWAADKLGRLGVEVLTRSPVTEIDATGIRIGETRIEAGTVLWAAGVSAPPLTRSLDVPLDGAGRVIVRGDLTLPAAPEVFVIGDLARCEKDGHPLPGTAPVAIQQGRLAAANILRAIRGLPYATFRYRDRGSLATIGRAAAVVERGRLRSSGWLAWVLWLGVHIVWLIGFRNRFLVLAEWAWAYLRYERGARLITGDATDRSALPAAASRIEEAAAAEQKDQDDN